MINEDIFPRLVYIILYTPFVKIFYENGVGIQIIVDD